MRDFVGETGLSVVGDGAHDIPKTKDFQLFDFVGETDVIGRGAASEPLKLAGSLQGTLCLLLPPICTGTIYQI